MEIINLPPDQIKKAAKVLSASFFNYPMFTFYFPDTARRKRYLPWYFRNILWTAHRYGKVYATSEISGVIFTLPPSHNQITLWEYVQNGFILSPIFLGLKNYIRSMESEKVIDNTRRKLMGNRQYYYLWGVAVDPELQKTGIGSILLEYILQKADTEDVPVYLETHLYNNVGYYENQNFSLIHTAAAQKFNIKFWCMCREPSRREDNNIDQAI